MSLRHPNAAIERGAYSAIVYLDGDLCVAEDNVGTIISEQAKSDHVSSVIQAAADEIGQGAIFVKNANEEYMIKSGVSYPAGISLISNGAKLNLENLNAAFLTIGSVAAEPYGKITGIHGFKLYAERTNPDTLFLKATNVNHGLSISNIVHERVMNVIELCGQCYCAHIHKVTGRNTGGKWIRLVAAAAYDAPCDTIISDCENTNGSAETGVGIGISIEASSTYTPLLVSIDNTWFEKFHTGINTESMDTKISNSYFQCNSYNIKLQKHATYSVAGTSEISNCHFEVRENGGIGIALEGDNYRHHKIFSNLFSRIEGVGIRNGSNSYLQVNDNHFSLSNATSVGIGQTGDNYIRYGSINNNTFMGDISTYRGTAISAQSTRTQIQNNNFMGLTYWLNQSNTLYAHIWNNYLYHITNMSPTVGTGCEIQSNYGYATENIVLSPTFAIDSTGIKTVTIPHGLAVTPAKEDCHLTVIEDTNADDWAFDLLKVESVGATNVGAKIHVSTASATGSATAKLALRVGKL